MWGRVYVAVCLSVWGRECMCVSVWGCMCMCVCVHSLCESILNRKGVWNTKTIQGQLTRGRVYHEDV